MDHIVDRIECHGMSTTGTEGVRLAFIQNHGTGILLSLDNAYCMCRISLRIMEQRDRKRDEELYALFHGFWFRQISCYHSRTD